MALGLVNDPNEELKAFGEEVRNQLKEKKE